MPLLPLRSVNSSNAFSSEWLLVACILSDRHFREIIQGLEELAGRFDGLVEIAVVQNDFMRAFMKEYEVDGTPSFLLFKKGMEMDRVRGAVSKREIENFIITNLTTEGGGT